MRGAPQVRCEEFKFQEVAMGMEWLQLCQKYGLRDLGWYCAYDLGCQLTENAWPKNSDFLKDVNDPEFLKVGWRDRLVGRRLRGGTHAGWAMSPLPALPCPAPPCPALSCPAVSCPTVPYHAIPHPALPCPTLLHSDPPYPTPPSHTLPHPAPPTAAALPHPPTRPAPPYPDPPFFTLPCPALQTMLEAVSDTVRADSEQDREASSVGTPPAAEQQ